MSVMHHLYLETLRAMQIASPEKLAAHQRNLLERMVRHARDNVPFYRERLSPLFEADRFRPEGWRNIPILTRADVQAHAAELQAETAAPEAGPAVEGSTSGTGGAPLTFRQSSVVALVSRCQTERMLEAHGIDRTAHQASIRLRVDGQAPYPLGQETTGWNLTCPASRQSVLDVRTPIAEQAEWLLRRRPKYLHTYPSNAAALAREIEAAGEELRLSGVLTIGEHVAPEHREDVKRVFGCRVFDSYGATEVGYLAFECPAGGGYHLACESALIEVTDGQGVPVPPGAMGQIVVTSLYNYAMPFIRYALGDCAVAAKGACLCGRTLPRIASIAGRVRNIFTFADGSQQSPWGWRWAFLRLVPATRMQIVQTAVDQIEIRYVPRPGAPPPDPALIDETARARVHPSVTARAVAVDDIPRASSGKVEDCISLVTPSLARFDRP